MIIMLGVSIRIKNFELKHLIFELKALIYSDKISIRIAIEPF